MQSRHSAISFSRSALALSTKLSDRDGALAIPRTYLSIRTTQPVRAIWPAAILDPARHRSEGLRLKARLTPLAVSAASSWLREFTSQLTQSVRCCFYASPVMSRFGSKEAVVAGKKTGKAAASAAARTLRSPSASKAAKRAAASDLAQVGNSKKSGAAAASAASKILRSPSASKAARSAAGSDLAQRARKRGK